MNAIVFVADLVCFRRSSSYSRWLMSSSNDVVGLKCKWVRKLRYVSSSPSTAYPTISSSPLEEPAARRASTVALMSIRYSDIDVSGFFFVALSFVRRALRWMLHRGDRNLSSSSHASLVVVQCKIIDWTDGEIVDLIHVRTSWSNFTHLL